MVAKEAAILALFAGGIELGTGTGIIDDGVAARKAAPFSWRER